MGFIQQAKENVFIAMASEAHQKGAMIFVARIMVRWRDNYRLSTAMPTVAGQIEAIERVGWRLEQFTQATQSSIGPDKHGAYCVFRRHQW
jgi:hypothetical protein